MKIILPGYILYVYPLKNTKCNVLYIFIICSILTKRILTDMKCIYCVNCTYLFGCILVYGSLLLLSSAHMMEQEISKGRNYFCFKYDKTVTSLNRKGNTTDMEIYNSRFLLIFFLNFNIYQAKIMLCY